VTTSLLADEVYLTCHDDRSGRVRGAAGVAGLAVAAGLLGEVILSGHVTIYQDGLYVIPTPQTLSDCLAREILRVVGDPRQDRDVRLWLRFVAHDAVHDVRDRLVTAGILTRVRGRGLRGRRWEYPPVHSNTAAWPGMRISRRLSLGEALTVRDTVLVSVIAATGLLGLIVRDEPDPAACTVQATRARQYLPEPLRALVAHTETAIADGVLTLQH
jgi:hypothetical protein